MGRGLDGYLISVHWHCAVLKAREGAGLDQFPVAMARGKHLFPFRTEPLSPSAPMVLGPQGPGRVGRRRFIFTVDDGTSTMQEVKKFLRANPQVLVLLVISLVLGLGTFLAVIFGLVSTHSVTTSGEPSGVIELLPLL